MVAILTLTVSMGRAEKQNKNASITVQFSF